MDGGGGKKELKKRGETQREKLGGLREIHRHRRRKMESGEGQREREIKKIKQGKGKLGG
jgi:hypothetical protein